MLTLVLAATVANAATLTVDDDGPADYASIQAAIDAATDGDIIEVAAGTYTEFRQYDTSYGFGLHLSRDITIRGAGPDQTIVQTGAGSRARTGCFGVTPGVIHATVIGLSCVNNTPGTVSATYAYSAIAEGSGYGQISGELVFENVVLGMPVDRQKSMVYHNNAGLNITFDNTITDFGTGASAGDLSYANRSVAGITLRNSIVTNTTAAVVRSSSTMVVDYTLVTPAAAPSGTGNISADPLFSGDVAAPYSLLAGSPAIDAGHPDPSFNDLDGSRNDMGIYGGPDGSGTPPLECPASHDIIDLPSGGTACIHPNATVADFVALGDGCRVDDGAFIASRAVVGSGVHVQDGVIVGRRATLGSNSTLQSGAVLSRGVQVGIGANIGPNAALGYASEVGNHTTVGANTVLGALASVGANADIGTSGMVILARDAHIGDGADVAGIGIIGPEVTIGTDFLAIGGFRIRKQATLQDTVTLQDGVRIGRDATVQANTQVAGSVAIGANACASGTVADSVARGQACQ